MIMMSMTHCAGMYVDSVIKVAKRELAWEVDYVREAECGTRFRCVSLLTLTLIVNGRWKWVWRWAYLIVMVVLIDPFCAIECVLLQVFLMVIFLSNPFCAKEYVLLQVFLIMMILSNPFSAKECVLLQVFLIAMFLISAKECALLQVFLMAMFFQINPFIAKIMCAADAVNSKKCLVYRSSQPEAFIF